MKRAKQHKARLLSCAFKASSIWLTALLIHNALTLSNSAFFNAFQFRLGLPPGPSRHHGCVVAVGPWRTPPPG